MKNLLGSTIHSFIFVSVSLSSISTFASERKPTCSTHDLTEIRNAATFIAKEPLTGGKCHVFYREGENDTPLYFEYVYSTSSGPYSCRLAKSAFIISNESSTTPSVPLLKCLKEDPLLNKEKWDTYYKEFNLYTVKTNNVLNRWHDIPKISLDPLPPATQTDHYKAAIYTTYHYTNHTNGTLPSGVEVWFTQADEMMETCNKIPNRENLSKEQLSYRFSELLGLPPDAPSDAPHTFAFITVPTKLVSGEIDYKGDTKIFNGFKGPGIFRPCASVMINTTDHICKNINDIPLDENILKQDLSKDDKIPTNSLLEKNLAKWSAYQFYKRYDNHDGWPHYPWTGRGYTYDWKSEKKDHYGLSEYVMEQNTEYTVYSTKTVEEFAKDCSDQ